MTKLQEVRSAIRNGNFTNQELNLLAEAINSVRTELAKDVKSGLSIGDNVSFISSRTGRNITGHVTKIAIKYVTVRTIDQLWKVPANMLSVIDN